ncbi:MAG: hypothetical protein IJA08_01920 [Clostridia bacterium]|nr:hypothetical protein [Clostridia bacterium]
MDVSKMKKVSGIVCIVLMLLVLLVQFWPGFFPFNTINAETMQAETGEASIAQVVWMPKTFKDAYNQHFKVANVSENMMAFAPAVQWLLTLFGIFLLVKCPKISAMGIFPILVGLVGIAGYLSVEAFRTHWSWYISIALAVLCVLGGLFYIVKDKILKEA